MVVVLDIGNTNIHCGLYRGERLVGQFTDPTSGRAHLARIMALVKGKKLDGAAIASVVPQLTPQFTQFFKKYLNVAPVIVSSHSVCNLKFGYNKPETLGADRIANIVGGLARYKQNLIVIDFGTATTIDVVFKNSYFAGGIIIPGIETSMYALLSRTALVKHVSLKKPQHIVGKTTEECTQSGIFNGTVVLIRGLIQMIEKKYKKEFAPVATGGWGKIMSSYIKEIKHFDADLTLFGILKIYSYNA